MDDLKYNSSGREYLYKEVRGNFFILLYAIVLVAGGYAILYSYAISKYGYIPGFVMGAVLVIFSIILSKQIISFLKAVKSVQKNVVRITADKDKISVYTPKLVFFKNGMFSFNEVLHENISQNLSFKSDFDLKLGNLCKIYRKEDSSDIFEVIFKFFDDQQKLGTIFSLDTSVHGGA